MYGIVCGLSQKVCQIDRNNYGSPAEIWNHWSLVEVLTAAAAVATVAAAVTSFVYLTFD